ncbi:MAG: sulfatase family protein [Planctomycetota bacterium]|jgi:arylsulfatase A-like enzyme
MPNNKPLNVLLLMTDQQRFDTIAAAGYSHMKTPNLDRLFNESIYFENARTPSPVCVAARYCMLTGCRSRQHNYTANDNHSLNISITTLPHLFSNAGYETRAIGKMHFKPARNHHGFHKMELMEEIPKVREDDEYAMYLKENGFGDIANIHGVRNLLYMLPQRSLIPLEHHGTTWVGNRTVDFLKKNKRRRPFFCFSSWIAPHPPFDLPHEWADLYKGENLPVPRQTETPLNPVTAVNKKHGDFPEKKYDQYLKRIQELYCAAVSHVDHEVGKVLDTLEECGLSENTIVIFTSDHGEMLGDYGIFQKMNPYDSCSRIPLLVKHPELNKKGITDKRMVSLLDVMPTLIESCGLKHPDHEKLCGQSLLNEKSVWQEQVMEFHKGQNRWISIFDGRFKYNYYYGGSSEELFDLVEDREEKVNLLYNNCPAEILEIKERLKKRLITYEKSEMQHQLVEDRCLKKFPEVDTSPITRRNSQFPAFTDKIQNQDEKNAMRKYSDEILEAVKDEEIVDLKELDLHSWQENGGDPEFVKEVML